MPGYKSMFLREFRIKGFRSCQDTHIRFQSEMTLLVGENNTGKSNIIEALRLATRPATDRRTRYFEDDDQTLGYEGPAELTAQFAELTPIQRAQYMHATDFETGVCFYGVRYRFEDGVPKRQRIEYTAGNPLAPDDEAEVRAKINHVYMAPLRDAHRELGTGSGSTVWHIVDALVGVTPEERQEFLEAAQQRLRHLEKLPLITKTSEQIQQHLTALTDPTRHQTVGLGYADETLQQLIRSLRVKMAEHGMSPVDLAASGLGYANLLFMATVVLELRNAQERN